MKTYLLREPNAVEPQKQHPRPESLPDPLRDDPRLNDGIPLILRQNFRMALAVNPNSEVEAAPEVRLSLLLS